MWEFIWLLSIMFLFIGIDLVADSNSTPIVIIGIILFIVSLVFFCAIPIVAILN